MPQTGGVQAPDEWARGWHHGAALYQHLSAGGVPAQVPTTLRLDGGPVYADVPAMYARYYAMNVSAQQSSMMAMGGPLFMLAAYTGNAISNASARSEAARMAAPQWREHAAARTIVTGAQTACLVHGRWLPFPHTAVVELNADLTRYSCLFTFPDVEPLLLHGPAVPYLTVLLAYLLYGAQRLPTLPFLAPLVPRVMPSGPPPLTGQAVQGEITS